MNDADCLQILGGDFGYFVKHDEARPRREQAEELKRTLQSLQGERDDRAAPLADKARRIEGYK